MDKFHLNDYERALKNWLIDNNIPFVFVDEHKKAAFSRSGSRLGTGLSRSGVKSFDFLLHSCDGKVILAEVKGRTFRGNSLANLTSLECWVTIDDIEGLKNWRNVFGKDGCTAPIRTFAETSAAFIFVYKMEAIDVDFDGREIFEYDAKRYLFLCVKLDDYCLYMKQRSRKWRTVTLPADKFRQSVIELAELLK
jgi:hypothetical protein